VLPVVDIYGAIVSVEMTSHVKTTSVEMGSGLVAGQALGQASGQGPLECSGVGELSALSAPVRLASGESPLASPNSPEQAADDFSRRSSHLLDSLENISTQHR